MKVRIKKLEDKAVVPFKIHIEDYCYDVVATSIKEVAPNVYQYGIGLAMEIDPDEMDSEFDRDVTICIDLRSRSSIWKTGMVLANSVGTIDEGYRGEILATFYHIMPTMPKYEVGDKIGQIALSGSMQVNFEVVNELSTTVRGVGSFGSTGK